MVATSSNYPFCATELNGLQDRLPGFQRAYRATRYPTDLRTVYGSDQAPTSSHLAFHHPPRTNPPPPSQTPAFPISPLGTQQSLKLCFPLPHPRNENEKIPNTNTSNGGNDEGKVLYREKQVEMRMGFYSRPCEWVIANQLARVG